MTLTEGQALLMVGALMVVFLVIWALSPKKAPKPKDEPLVKAVECPVCNGSGWSPLDPDYYCDSCGGDGEIVIYRDPGSPVVRDRGRW